MRQIILILALFMLTGCAVSQEMKFYTNAEIQTTEKGWNITKNGHSIILSILRTDESTSGPYGYIEKETIVIQMRRLQEDITYYIPGDTKIIHSIRRGDKVDTTNDAKGTIKVFISSGLFKITNPILPCFSFRTRFSIIPSFVHLLDGLPFQATRL